MLLQKCYCLLTGDAVIELDVYKRQVKDISLVENAETVWKGTKRTAKMPKVLG